MSDTVETITLDEFPHYRARIVTDDYSDAPYDDGSSPVIRLEYRSGWTAEQVTEITSHVVAPEILTAAAHFGSEADKFERYLRLFHGTTEVQWFSGIDRDADYVTFDTKVWREEMGLTDEHIAAHPEHDFRLASADEYRAYLEGDAYGIIVEQEVAVANIGETDEDTDVWEEGDSLWGFYGDVDGYVTETATEMLKDAAQKDGVVTA